MTTTSRLMVECDSCGSKFEFGPSRFAGQHIEKYKLTVCDPCYNGNWDGWGPAREPNVIAHLKRQGIPIPARNEKGWLPRDG